MRRREIDRPPLLFFNRFPRHLLAKPLTYNTAIPSQLVRFRKLKYLLSRLVELEESAKIKIFFKFSCLELFINTCVFFSNISFVYYFFFFRWTFKWKYHSIIWKRINWRFFFKKKKKTFASGIVHSIRISE